MVDHVSDHGWPFGEETKPDLQKFDFRQTGRKQGQNNIAPPLSEADSPLLPWSEFEIFYQRQSIRRLYFAEAVPRWKSLQAPERKTLLSVPSSCQRCHEMQTLHKRGQMRSMQNRTQKQMNTRL